MARKEKGLVSRIVSFSVGWIIGILISILISIWNFFRKKRGGRGNKGWCGSAYKYSYKSTYKYSYKLTYKYLEIFPEGEGEEDLWKGKRERGFGFPRFFVGFRPGRQLVSRLTI